MSLPTISPADAKRLLDQGAKLIDIRGRDEHARERIPGAESFPVENLVRLLGKRSLQLTGVRIPDIDAFVPSGGEKLLPVR